MCTADGGAAVREPGPGGTGPPRGMAWQEGLRMAPEVRRRRLRRAALQQARTGDAGPPRVGSSSDGGRRGTSSRGGSCRSTALRATQQQRGGYR